MKFLFSYHVGYPTTGMKTMRFGAPRLFYPGAMSSVLRSRTPFRLIAALMHHTSVILLLIIREYGLATRYNAHPLRYVAVAYGLISSDCETYAGPTPYTRWAGEAWNLDLVAQLGVLLFAPTHGTQMIKRIHSGPLSHGRRFFWKFHLSGFSLQQIDLLRPVGVRSFPGVHPSPF